MRPRMLMLLVLIAAACDIEFVGVEGETERPATVHFSVASHHIQDLEARIYVRYEGEARRPRLRVQGVEAIMLRSERGWELGDTVVVDSLSPVLDLSFEAEDDCLAIRVPLLARRGSSRPSTNGDLLIPVVRDGSVLEESFNRWRAVLTDSAGRRLLELTAEGPLPDSLVIPAVLLPEGAADVDVYADGYAGPTSFPTSSVHTWVVTTASSAMVPIDRP